MARFLALAGPPRVAPVTKEILEYFRQNAIGILIVGTRAIIRNEQVPRHKGLTQNRLDGLCELLLTAMHGHDSEPHRVLWHSASFSPACYFEAEERGTYSLIKPIPPGLKFYPKRFLLDH